MKWKIRQRRGHKIKEKVPVIHDLLFVNSTREKLDPAVARIATLQYRFLKGGRFGESMTVSDESMARFIAATSSDPDAVYYSPSEINASMIGRKVRIIGGILNGYTGNLLSVRGMRKKRLIVSLPDMVIAAVEVEPDYIEFV